MKMVNAYMKTTVDDPDEELESWGQVYAGLSDTEMCEVESIAFDRSHFMAQEI